jgi:UDP-N-acetylmuramoyl-tripeptide--D-alanyl-D-alanine ligase
MKAKGELLENITKEGTAILNADDEMVMRLRKKTHTQTLLFGTSKKASIRAEAIREKNHKISFKLKTPTGGLSVTLNTPGRFMVSNALAAAATGYCVGIEIQEIKSALEVFVTDPGRMNIFSTSNGIHIIDDSYNANPDSMKVAISTLNQLAQGKQHLIVLGDMFELGDKAAGLHYEIGAFAANSETSRLYAVGSFAKSVAQGAMEKGMDENRIMTGTKASICDDLIQRLEPGDWVLVKGSRAMVMEEIVKKLTIWGNGEGI